MVGVVPGILRDMSFLRPLTRSARDGVGQPVLRKDDARLLVGDGCYSDDVNLPGQAYACFVRSPHAHARVGRIETAAARATPGVIAVLTGADAVADGLKPLTHSPMPANPHEEIIRRQHVAFLAPHPPIPADRVRFVGEVVAMVIARDAGGGARRRGARRRGVDARCRPRPPASRPPRRPRRASMTTPPSNVCVDVQAGRSAPPRTPPSRRPPTWCGCRRGSSGSPACRWSRARRWASGIAASGRYTVHAGAGGLGRTRTGVAGALGVPESAVRVVARDVGGNFGTRNSCYPEFALVAWAARRVGRPVKWTCERREAFLADYQGRDLASHAELALDADGTFVAFRAVNTSNVGAHAVSFHPLNKGTAIATTVYHVPAVSMRARAVVTTTSPTTPYRSAGRPEVMFVMERLIDLAARRHGFDRLELRRRNLVPAGAMPYRNGLGVVYDSGDYRAALRSRGRSSPTGRASRRAGPRRAGADAIAASASPTTSSSTPAIRASAPTSRCGPKGGSTWCSARSRPGRGTPRASPSCWSSGSAWRSPTCG